MPIQMMLNQVRPLWGVRQGAAVAAAAGLEPAEGPDPRRDGVQLAKELLLLVQVVGDVVAEQGEEGRDGEGLVAVADDLEVDGVPVEAEGQERGGGVDGDHEEDADDAVRVLVSLSPCCSFLFFPPLLSTGRVSRGRRVDVLLLLARLGVVGGVAEDQEEAHGDGDEGGRAGDDQGQAVEGERAGDRDLGRWQDWRPSAAVYGVRGGRGGEGRKGGGVEGWPTPEVVQRGVAR